MAIADKLTYLNATKALLREAITRAGHYLTEADPFRSYPYALLRDEYSLKLDFLRGEYIAKNWRDGTVSRVGSANIISFTRGSGGGRFNHLGVFEWVGSNVPRIDHDPATVDTSTSSVTIGAGLKTFAVSRLYPVGQYVRATADASNWVSGRVVASTGSSVTLWVDRVVGTGTFTSWTLIRALGLLVEEGRTNLLFRSSDFANAAWVKTNVNVDGVTGGYKLRPVSPSTAFTRVQNPIPGAAFSGRINTVSFEIEAAGWRYVQIHGGFNEYGESRANFDLLTGATNVAGGVTAEAVRRGGDRWQITATFTATGSGADGTATICFVPALNSARGAAPLGANDSDGVIIYTSDNQVGAFPTSHIPTTSSQVTRAADVATVADATDWRSPEGTLILEHDAPSTRQLLSSGANLLMTSQGPGKIAVAFTAGGSLVCYNGGTPVAGPALTFDTALKLMGGAASFASAHARWLDFIPRALAGADLQRLTS